MSIGAEFSGSFPDIALANNITSSDMSFDAVGSGAIPGAPTGTFIISITTGGVTEKMIVAVVINRTFIISVRGYDGSFPVAHTAGSLIKHVIPATLIDEASAHIDAPLYPSSDVQVFTVDGTWNKPMGGKLVYAQCLGAGGGGGRPNGPSISGGLGGGGGALAKAWIPASQLSNSISVVVGIGGTGRTATAGFGTPGGHSMFGELFAGGGGGGGWGAASTAGGGGGGTGATGVSDSWLASAPVPGTTTPSTSPGAAGIGPSYSYGGEYGGGGGGWGKNGQSANGGDGGHSIYGGGGGGAGASGSASLPSATGGSGGLPGGATGEVGTTAGAAGSNGTNGGYREGGGGGGATSSAAGNGGTGGVGAGGGGGGNYYNVGPSGNGGNGGRGEVIVVTYF